MLAARCAMPRCWSGPAIPKASLLLISLRTGVNRSGRRQRLKTRAKANDFTDPRLRAYRRLPASEYFLGGEGLDLRSKKEESHVDQINLHSGYRHCNTRPWLTGVRARFN